MTTAGGTMVTDHGRFLEGFSVILEEINVLRAYIISSMIVIKKGIG